MIELLVNTLLVNRDVEAHFFPSCLQVRKNVLDVSYHISQYQNIISELRGEIGRLKEKIQSEAVFGGPSSGVKKAELQEMREQMVTNFKEQMNLRYFKFFLNHATSFPITLCRFCQYFLLGNS